MSSSCGSPEDAGKQRGRDGKIRREDGDDSQPEGKRLKLGNEGANIAKDREAAAQEAAMPCSGREEPVPEGGDGAKSFELGKLIPNALPLGDGKGKLVWL
ncbi:hypothetical protein WISP_12776 [Willisornis vidua]|uniref:Uncharacterized protein n=1 Tax=Willisornis vidua TaxID=1566151 RepID=A0ABQ9DRH9_9PASS|nr:hypothetical protein WISP_12776 [Willisornis vidua]